jgi:hypothetical protein
MIKVADLLPNLKSSEYLGSCKDETAFDYLTRAQAVLAAKSLWRPLEGYMDICVSDRCVTLPRGVKTPLAINIDGQPTLPTDRWFEFHLNGPGSYGGDWETSNSGGWVGCQGQWVDLGRTVQFQDILQPSKLVAVVDVPEDGTGSQSLWVYGYDQDDRWIQTRDLCNPEVIRDGMPVPMVYGYPLPYQPLQLKAPTPAQLLSPTLEGSAEKILVKRITRVTKPVTKGFVSLVAWDPGRPNGTSMIGQYWPQDTEPAYTRIRLASHLCPPGNTWVRMRYRKETFKITSGEDLIPLMSPQAILLMVKALRKQGEDDIVGAEAYEQKAVQYLMEEQSAGSPPVYAPIQVAPGVGYGDVVTWR